MNQNAGTPALPEELSTEVTSDTNDILLPDIPPSPAVHNDNITLPDIASPLLVTIYEFERGSGTMDISLVDNGSLLLGMASDLLQSAETNS